MSETLRVESLRPVEEAIDGQDAQCGGDEERQRQRHLADDEPTPQPQARAAGSGAAAAFLERFRQPWARCLNRRDQTEDERRRLSPARS